jgi:predicted transcriptional regulator
MSKKTIMQSTVDVVKAYVAGNKVPVGELPRLVKVVSDALTLLEKSTDSKVVKARKPAISIRKSVSRDSIVCLEDGKAFKALKRHLRTAHGLTPEEYRAKWGLEKYYPMVAPAYSKRRTRLARKMRLGHDIHRRSVSPKTAKGQLTDAA